MQLDQFRHKLTRAVATATRRMELQRAKSDPSANPDKRRQQAAAAARRIVDEIVKPRMAEFASQLGLPNSARKILPQQTAGGAKCRCAIGEGYSLILTVEPGSSGRLGVFDLRIGLYHDGHITDRPGVITIRADDQSEDDEIGSWVEYQLIKRVAECVQANSPLI